jgi:hypothetical protein
MKSIVNLGRQWLQRKEGGVANEWDKMAKLIQTPEKQCRKISTCLAQSFIENVSISVKPYWIGRDTSARNDIRKLGKLPKCKL